MISGDDIEAMCPDLEIASRIVDRARSGATGFRLIHANEELPLIRAFMTMLSAAELSTAFMVAAKQSADDGMGCFDQNGKRIG